MIEKGSAQEIANYCKENNLTIKDGRIVPINEDIKAYCKSQIPFWWQRQQARKILLNSLYGALLNEALRFSDERMGQSVTLTGRSISRHMNAYINEILTGEYDHTGKAVIYADTDSISFDSQILSSHGSQTIEDLFLNCSVFKNVKDKEYAYDPDLKVMSYDPKTDLATMMPIEYIYRHKVSKAKWKVTDNFGNEVIITGDHSIMVERDGNLMEVKPAEILETDVLISIN